MMRRSSGQSNQQLLVTMGLIGLVVLALGVGLLLGRITGGAPTAPAAGTTPAVVHSIGQPCGFELPVEDRWMLKGMICNCDEPHCNRTPLLDCHCNTAHSMKELVKELIAEGKDPLEIGRELESRWGPGIVPEDFSPTP